MAPQGLKRKLAAIFSADVEGYSLLMRDDEEATILTLATYRTAMTYLIQKFSGRVVDAPGDNLLAEFASVVDAVNCAVEIQRELAELNADLPKNRKMQFRIGINLGDVVEEEERIYGDGVNIAARMEGLAEGGGICISGTAYDQVKHKIGLEYDYLGEQEVKNFIEPVRTYRILLFPGAATHRVIKAKKAVAKPWRNVVVGIAAVLAVGAALVIWNSYSSVAPTLSKKSEQMDLHPNIRDSEDRAGELQSVTSKSLTDITAERKRLEQKHMELERIKMEMEKAKIDAERKRLEEEKKALAAKRKQEEKLEAEKKRLEEERKALEEKIKREEKLRAERKRLEEEKRALAVKREQEEKLKQEKAQIKQSADTPQAPAQVIPDPRSRLAVFPFCEFTMPQTEEKYQKQYINFIINYTSEIPNIILTHSFYGYNTEKADHEVDSIKEMISKDLNRAIWYGTSKRAKIKPDFNTLKKLSEKIDSDLILTFKIETELSDPIHQMVNYNGYLVDINKNIIHETVDHAEDFAYTDFSIVKKMTKELFELYQNSNPIESYLGPHPQINAK